MFNVSSLLEEIKASPYKELSVLSPHSGTVSFPTDINVGTQVFGPMGEWKEVPGTLLATMTRERNPNPIHCPEKGEIISVNTSLHDKFVEAGTELIRYRHFLSKDEVLQRILRQALHLFLAPEKAKYYFIPSVDIKIKVSGPKSITVRDGEEIFIMSRMKRETPLRYTGPEGVIYAVYFSHNQNVDAGQPLIGICPPDQVQQVEDVVARVQTDWIEQG